MKDKRFTSFFVCITLMAFLFFVGAYGQYLIENNRINDISQPTNSIQNVFLSQNFNKPKIDSLKFTISYNGKTKNINDKNLIKSEICEVGLTGGNSIKNIIDLLIKNGSTLEESFNKMYTNLNTEISEFIKEYEKKPIDSQVTFSPNEKEIFKYTDSQNGILLNKEKFYQDLYDNLDKRKINIELQLSTATPKFTKELNTTITKEVSHFITDLSTSKKNRFHNVTNALNKINGLVIQPNQKVSFNELTSPHSKENGYVSATVISNGEYVNGIGGGICQASTTVYNAVLLAGLEVQSVFKHSIPVKYVKMGFDSMVSNYADMVFTNTSEYPIYFKAYTDKENAYVYIYGKTMEENQKIVRRNEIVREITPPQTLTIIDEDGKYSPKVQYEDQSFELKYARTGYEVNSYLDYYTDGKLINTKKIRHEIYAPQGQVLVKGTKKREEIKTEENNSKQNEKIENTSNETKIENININGTSSLKLNLNQNNEKIKNNLSNIVDKNETKIENNLSNIVETNDIEKDKNLSKNVENNEILKENNDNSKILSNTTKNQTIVNENETLHSKNISETKNIIENSTNLPDIIKKNDLLKDNELLENFDFEKQEFDRNINKEKKERTLTNV